MGPTALIAQKHMVRNSDSDWGKLGFTMASSNVQLKANCIESGETLSSCSYISQYFILDLFFIFIK